MHLNIPRVKRICEQWVLWQRESGAWPVVKPAKNCEVYFKSRDNLLEPLQDPHSGTRMPRLEMVYNYDH